MLVTVLRIGEQVEMMSRRAWIALLVLPLGICWLHWRWRVQDPLLRFDPDIYLDGAESLARHQGYRLANFVGTPAIGLYPPLQSLLLSLAWVPGLGLPDNLARTGWLMLAADGIALSMVMATALRFGSPLPVASFITLLVGLNPSWFQCGTLRLSDFSFTAICLATALPWIGRGRPASLRLWFFTGLGLGLAYASRKAALPFIGILAAVVVARLGTVGWRPLAAALLPVLFSVLAVRQACVGGMGYGENFRAWWPEFGEWPGYLTMKAQDLLTISDGRQWWKAVWAPAHQMQTLARSHGPIIGGAVHLIFTIGFWGILAAAARGIRRGSDPVEPVLAAMMAGYIGTAWVTPIPNSIPLVERYLFPLVPFVMAWAWRGAAGMAVRLEGPSARFPATRGIVAVMATAMLATTASTLWRATEEIQQSNRWRDELNEVIVWLRGHAAPTERLAVGYNQPHMQLADLLGRPLVIDYFSPEPVPFLPMALTHDRQGSPFASYLLSTPKASEDPQREGVIEQVLATSGGRYRLYRVNPFREAAWRKERGIPPPASDR